MIRQAEVRKLARYLRISYLAAMGADQATITYAKEAQDPESMARWEQIAQDVLEYYESRNETTE